MGVKVLRTIICEFVDCGHSEPIDVDVPWDGGYGASDPEAERLVQGPVPSELSEAQETRA